MATPLPAVSLAAVPGRRKAMIEVGREIERRGFDGIYCPSFGDAMALAEALAFTTERITIGTSVQPIYTRPAQEFASHASFIQEVSGGRFKFGIGVSHEPSMARLGIAPTGKPLTDMRNFVQGMRDAQRVGTLPPIVLAGLRQKMVALAGEVAEGVVFANGSRSHMAKSLSVLPAAKRSDPNFFIGDMIPTCISDDLEAAKAVNRATLTGYVMLPNYRNYWKEAGYVEEMEAVEKALAARERDKLPSLLSDRWLADNTLFGTATQVRDGLEQWYAAGVRTPIIVPSSAVGNQMKAFEELFQAFS